LLVVEEPVACAYEGGAPSGGVSGVVIVSEDDGIPERLGVRNRAIYFEENEQDEIGMRKRAVAER
jgi:hypothetical protein